MSINNILGNMPSLVDYMFQDDRNSTASSLGYATSQTIDMINLSALQQQTQSDAYVIDLSAEAQELLNQQETKAGNSSIQNAQAHFLGFFEDNGIDLDTLSGSGLELIKGIITFLGESGTTGRDSSTDTLESKVSNGERDVYTLTGENRRIRIAIEKDDTGQKILTLTDLHDNIADVAKFSIEKDEAGKDVIKLERIQDTFSNGRRVDRIEKDPATYNLS